MLAILCRIAGYTRGQWSGGDPRVLGFAKGEIRGSMGSEAIVKQALSSSVAHKSAAEQCDNALGHLLDK